MSAFSLSKSIRSPGFWLDDPAHRRWLADNAESQFAFFRASLRPDAGFHTLGLNGRALPNNVQELHTTTRLIHAYALGELRGIEQSMEMVDHGIGYLNSHHRDILNGGYFWALGDDGVADGRKLAYGHVFVLLAAASALQAGHRHAESLLAQVCDVLDEHFWEEDHGLFCDEFEADWTPFSTYRGMNANMHGVEALLTAYEAVGEQQFLDRAGRILDFFVTHIAANEGWRLPEHYTDDWQIDRSYAGNPMFRPAGTTPGHSFELGRLLLQYWDLRGRPDDGSPASARRLIEQACKDAWDNQRGGFAYTLNFDGSVAIADRYWWPVTEAIGAFASLIKLERRESDEEWYRQLWVFSDKVLIDHDRGGWFPELDADNRPTDRQFRGKPDIYHSIQACLFPLAPGLSGLSRPG